MNMPENLKSPRMTAEWENTLMQIERGEVQAAAFLKGISNLVSKLVHVPPLRRTLKLAKKAWATVRGVDLPFMKARPVTAVPAETALFAFGRTAHF